MKIYPYKMTSESAKALAQALGVKRIRPEGKPIKVDHVINWGSSRWVREVACETYSNGPLFVERATNKLEAFRTLSGHVTIPEFTEERVEATKWLVEGCKMVVCRTVLNGHSGHGIVLSTKEEELVDAPLYVKYIPKKHEYRLHTHAERGVFFVQQKKKREGVDANFQIRNHANGFIYANDGVDVPEHVKEMCKKAIITLGLDFGAVDVIYNEKFNTYTILEVNTAPGLAGTTLEKYVQLFTELYK